MAVVRSAKELSNEARNAARTVLALLPLLTGSDITLAKAQAANLTSVANTLDKIHKAILRDREVGLNEEKIKDKNSPLYTTLSSQLGTIYTALGGATSVHLVAAANEVDEINVVYQPVLNARPGVYSSFNVDVDNGASAAEIDPITGYSGTVQLADDWTNLFAVNDVVLISSLDNPAYDREYLLSAVAATKLTTNGIMPGSDDQDETLQVELIER